MREIGGFIFVYLTFSFMALFGLRCGGVSRRWRFLGAIFWPITFLVYWIGIVYYLLVFMLEETDA